MKRAKKLNKFLTGFLAVLAYLGWDAGQRFSESRGQVGWWGYGPQDANEANCPEERLEVIRKAQHFERNNAITNRLVDVFEQFTVGAGGMPVMPSSSDEDWNRKRKELWDMWCKNPDLTSLQDFGTMQSLIARRWFVDGEVFIFKTRSDRAPYRARIQIIEAMRVQTPPDVSGNRIFDGVEVDSKGRPIAYWVCDHAGYTDGFSEQQVKFKRIDAKDIIHVHEPMRPGQYRSLSFLAPVLGDIQDLDELCKLAMNKAKDAAEITNVHVRRGGELPSSESRRLRRFETTEQTATGTDVSRERVEHMRRVLGSRTVSVDIDEDIKQLRAQSPNEIEQAHWDIITNRICAGVGISKIFVFPNSMQGTVVRADLDIAATFFRARASVIAAAVQEIYEYVTEEDCKIERSIADKPHDWRRSEIRPPRAPNVDVGHNSAALIAEYEAGITNLRLICLPLGLDWKKLVMDRAEEEAFIDAAAKEKGTTPERIKKSIGDLLKEKMAMEAKSREQEDAIAA
jgi:capsid protein